MKKLMLLLICIVLLLTTPVSAQDGPTQVGSAKPGRHTLEFVVEIEQEGFNISAFGYFTYIAGLDPLVLFTEETSPLMRTEATARFTVHGTGEVVVRSVHKNIFTTVLNFTFNVYYNETPLGSTFDDPTTFIGGDPLATYSIRFQNILNVQEPNVGVGYSTGEAVQSLAGEFTLNGQSYVLGAADAETLFTLFGQGFRSSEEPLLAEYFLVGNATALPE